MEERHAECMYATTMIWFSQTDGDPFRHTARLELETGLTVRPKLYKKSGGHRLGTTVQSESQLQSHPRRQSPNHEDPGELPQIVLEEIEEALRPWGNGAIFKVVLRKDQSHMTSQAHWGKRVHISRCS